MMYLWKTKTDVFFCSDKKMAAEQGYTQEPDKEVTDEVWEANDCLARLNAKGNIVLGKTEDEIKEEKSNQLRSQRDQLLSFSDKYMIEDFAITEEYKEKIKAYRQELRDLPESEDWPEVEFPKFPEE